MNSSAQQIVEEWFESEEVRVTLTRWCTEMMIDPRQIGTATLLAFCAAARNAEPLRAMLRCVGMDIMTEEDRKLAEYARTLIQQKKMKRQLRKLEDEL